MQQPKMGGNEKLRIFIKGNHDVSHSLLSGAEVHVDESDQSHSMSYAGAHAGRDSHLGSFNTTREGCPAQRQRYAERFNRPLGNHNFLR